MTNLERLGELLGTGSDGSLSGCDGIKCPEEFAGKACPGCPYEHFWSDEYKGWDGEQ